MKNTILIKGILICSLQPHRLALANAAEENAKFLGLANELVIDADGWALIPYGDSTHKGKNGLRSANAKDNVHADSPTPVIQRFDRDAAQAIVDDFKSTWGRIKRAVVGLPIFKGHPDSPRWEKHFPDKTPRGTIADMEVGDQGLRIKPVLTEQGARDVEAGWSAFSPFWNNQIRDRSGQTPIYGPIKLWSIGLLPPGRENIRGLSLANAAEPVEGDSLSTENSNSEITMKQHLIKLLAAMGITVAADAADTQIEAGVTQACGALATANAREAELVTLKTEKAKVDDQLVSANAAKAKADADMLALANAKDAEIAEAKAKVAAERTARAKLVVVSAVQTGRVSAADLESQTLALANAADFDAEAAKINALKPKLRTSSDLSALGKEGKDMISRQNTTLALVNARMEDADIKAMPEHARYDAAFNSVIKDPKNAAIVDAMKKPEVAAK